MLNLAFMILAHHRFDHLDRLLAAIKHPDSVAYAHVDAKLSDLPVQRQHVEFTRQRFDVQWAGFSQIQATLALMRTAIQNPAHDYFILLSGVDYPIRQIDELYEFLENNRWDYINITEFGKVGKSIERIVVRYDERGGGRSQGLTPKMYRWKNLAFRQLYRITKIGRQLPKGMTVRDFLAGSQWFAFTRSTVETILRYVDANPDFVRFCMDCSFTDEFFFQSIIRQCGLEMNCRPNLHYTDWRKGTPPFPSELTDVHLQDLMHAIIVADEYGPSRPAFFARKVGPGSANVLRAVDEKLLCSHRANSTPIA